MDSRDRGLAAVELRPGEPAGRLQALEDLRNDAGEAAPLPRAGVPRPVAARRRRALGGRAGQEGRGVSAAEPSSQ